MGGLFFKIVGLAMALEGFYPLQGTYSPSWVTNHKESVYQIVLHNSYESSEKLSSKRIENFKKVHCAKPSTKVYELNCKHFDNCEGDKCNYYPYDKLGTSFLVGEGDRLLTAFHVIYPLHEFSFLYSDTFSTTKPTNEVLQAATYLRPEFLLINHKGEIVFNTKEEDTLPYYLNVGLPSKFSALDMISSPEKLRYDFCEILLPRKIGTGLKLAQASDQSKRYYSLGFPKKIKRPNGHHSQGGKLYLSIGKQVDFEETTKKLARKIHLDINAFLSVKDLGIIATDMDLAPGNSGGPLFNEDGEVVGIMTSTLYGPYQSYAGLSYALPISVMKDYDLRPHYQANGIEL